MRKLFFNLHWFFGITAGLVIAIVGLTGAMLSFEPQILRWLNPGIITVEKLGEAKSPVQLINAVTEQSPQKKINALTITRSAELAYSVRFAPEPGQRRGEMQYLNQYSGELLGQAQGRPFFVDVMRLHRWLLVGDVGKQIVGASTMILLFMALSGIYLRWPKGNKKWQPGYWLKLHPLKSGRAFWWKLHAVVGTWVLPLYLLASLTGLYWSYEWYRDVLYTVSGVEQSSRRSASSSTPSSVPNEKIDAVWQTFVDQNIDYRIATLHLPLSDQAQISFLYADATHERQTNQVVFATDDLRQISLTRFADKPLNEKLMNSILPLHSGEYFGMTGLVLMMIASLMMPLFFITGFYLYLSRKKRIKISNAM